MWEFVIILTVTLFPLLLFDTLKPFINKQYVDVLV